MSSVILAIAPLVNVSGADDFLAFSAQESTDVTQNNNTLSSGTAAEMPR